MAFSSLLMGSGLAYGKTPVELQKSVLLGAKIEILLPQTFKVMSEKMVQAKYPNGNRPKLIYTNPEGSVNIAFNHTPSRLQDTQMAQFTAAMKKVLLAQQPKAVWIADGVINSNRKQIGFLEALTPATDTQIYNLMFFVELDGKALLISFNCLEKDRHKWQPLAKEIMKSLKLK